MTQAPAAEPPAPDPAAVRARLDGERARQETARQWDSIREATAALRRARDDDTLATDVAAIFRGRA